MKIWVDGDACPKPVKEVVFKTAQRREIHVTVVSNQNLRVPRSPWIDAMVVAKGFDVADETIIQALQAGDVVITADIPLAAEAVKKNASAIDFRGDLYDEETIPARLAMRDLMQQLRDQGMQGGGPPPFTAKDRQKFVNALETLLTRLCRDP